MDGAIRKIAATANAPISQKSVIKNNAFTQTVSGLTARPAKDVLAESVLKPTVAARPVKLTKFAMPTAVSG